MKTLQLLVLALAAGIAAVATNVNAADKRPNILYIYVDDMGWGSIGPNGQADRRAKNLPYVRTPNIDALAASGVNFQRAYACTVCSPSRSSQQTGFHQGHTFADRNDPNNAKKAIRADDVTIGDSLSNAGYVTGYWGKWGYGGSKDRANPVIENVQTLPTAHGYQHVLAELHHVRAHTFFQPTLWHAPTTTSSTGGLELIPNTLNQYVGNGDYPNNPAQQNHAEYPKTAYCDDMYSFAALDFVRDQGTNYNKTEQPFFGLLAVQIPHSPFGDVTQLPSWDEAYVDDAKFKTLAKQSQQWSAMVTRMDAHLGNILAALEDPNNDGDKRDSVADNTLVIFQSDNGGPAGASNKELGANGGLRGQKGRIFEGGIRVPLIMRWPAKINASSKLKAGTNSQMVVDITDLLPTFCDLAGTETPLGVDGVSIAPTLLGVGQQRKRDFIIHEAGNQQSIIRGNHKLIRSKNSRLELYDLVANHTESNDIANNHPELAKELETLLLAERVTEPRGFAVTYHEWSGDDGGNISNADHWSDYKYANAGVTYMSDKGSPRPSWIARIANSTGKNGTVISDAKIEFLALVIEGSRDTKSTQTLIVKHSSSLMGRNTIRIEQKGVLKLEDAIVSTLRWVDIDAGGRLEGSGEIAGNVSNDGTVASSGKGIIVRHEYEQTRHGTLQMDVHSKSASDHPLLRIEGQAKLGGMLVLREGSDDRLTVDKLIALTANEVHGVFENEKNEVTTSDGTRFEIVYSPQRVVLQRKP